MFVSVFLLYCVVFIKNLWFVMSDKIFDKIRYEFRIVLFGYEGLMREMEFVFIGRFLVGGELILFVKDLGDKGLRLV